MKPLPTSRAHQLEPRRIMSIFLSLMCDDGWSGRLEKEWGCWNAGKTGQQLWFMIVI